MNIRKHCSTKLGLNLWIRIGLLTWGFTHPLYLVGASLDS